MSEIKRKCYSIRCANYPICKNSAGSCCAIEWDDETCIPDSECYDIPDHPYFKEKPPAAVYGCRSE